MATYHCHVSRIRRALGRSAIAAASYRAGVRLEFGGCVFDYTHKRGVLHSEIVGWAGTRKELWQAAELAEHRRDGTPAREVLTTLPRELSDAQRRALCSQFARWMVQQYGVAVDLSIHEPARIGRRSGNELDDTEEDARQRTQTNSNHHCHFLISTRRTLAGGLELGAKTVELDQRPSGAREIKRIREAWERHVNAALRAAHVSNKEGQQVEVSRLSQRARGLSGPPARKQRPGEAARKRRCQEYTPDPNEVAQREQLEHMRAELVGMLAELRQMHEQLDLVQRIEGATALADASAATLAERQAQLAAMRGQAPASPVPGTAPPMPSATVPRRRFH